jgi:SnoaL-like domain
MALEGKGFFTWKIPNCENGDAKVIASHANAAGLTHLILKIADGTMIYYGNWGDPKDYTTPVVNALRANGIKVWGWHYVYGDDPIGEANVAITRIRQYNLDGYVIDAEREYEKSTKKSAAKKFMAQLRSSCPDLIIALSSYRFPSLHPQLPWVEFLDQCNINMPQVYWMKAHNPGDQLSQCVKELQAKVPSRPIVPTGAAFREFGWKPSDGEVLEFCKKAKELNLSGVNFWEWSDARSGNLPGVWDTIQQYKWREKDEPKDICVRLMEAINAHNVDEIMSLYTLPAVHINGVRTTQGFDALRSWYTQLFNQVLPNGNFVIGSYNGKGSSRHMTWTATSPKAVVRNGSDTFGLVKGKISYHYSFFNVTPLTTIAQ